MAKAYHVAYARNNTVYRTPPRGRSGNPGHPKRPPSYGTPKKGGPKKKPRVHNRLGNPFTSTLLKTLTKELGSSGQHNDMDKEFGKIVLHKPRKFFKEFGLFKLVFSRQFFFTNNVDGRQSYGDGYSIASAYQCAGATIAAPTELGLIQNRNNYFDYNPAQALTGGQAAGLSAVLAPNPDKIVLKTIEYEMSVYNAETLSTEVEVFFLLCKRDTLNGPSLTWEKAMTNERLGQAAWTQPSTGSTGNFTEGYGSPDAYGMTPFKFKEFNMFWKKLKSYKFMLPGGDTHRIKTQIQFNKVIDKAYALTALSSGNNYLKGYSIVPLFLARGAIVKHDDGATSSFTYGRPRVAVVSTVTHNLSSVGQGRVSYQRVGAQIHSGNPLSDYIIDDVDAISLVKNI